MRLEFLKPNDARWMQQLARIPHQFYHMPAYCQLEAERKGGAAEAVLVTEGDEVFFVPYIITSLKDHGFPHDDLYDLQSPYGYPGPLVQLRTHGFLSAAMQVWREIMRSRKVVCGFIRLDPLGQRPLEEFSELGVVQLRGTTVSVDLQQEFGDLWRQMRRNLRSSVRRAVHHRLSYCMKEGNDIDAAAITRLYELYDATMNRVGAQCEYRFSWQALANFVQQLRDHVMLTEVCDEAGRSLSMGLMVESCEVVQYHLQAATVDGLELGGTKYLFHRSIESLRAQNRKLLHLGGGLGRPDDSLLKFKQGFSKRTHDYFTWHIVFMPAEYSRTLNATLLADAAGYFPAYRRKVVAHV